MITDEAYYQDIAQPKRKCRVCGERLHYLVTATGKTGSMQCLNRDCKNYGKSIS